MTRKYLPTFAELIDRMSIVQMKAIFIPEHSEAYKDEIRLILHDIDEIITETPDFRPDAKTIHAILLVMLSNRVVWENESIARQGGSDQDARLKFTHSINGVRNSAKNIIAAKIGGRQDWKIDSFAAELVEQFGNWRVFE